MEMLQAVMSTFAVVQTACTSPSMHPYAQNVRCIVDRPSYLRSSATLSSASILKLRANGILDCKIHTLASKYVWYGLQLNQFKTAMLGIIGLIGAAAGALRTKLLVHGPRHSMLK